MKKQHKKKTKKAKPVSCRNLRALKRSKSIQLSKAVPLCQNVAPALKSKVRLVCCGTDLTGNKIKGKNPLILLVKPSFIYSANKNLSQKGNAASPSWMVAALRLSQDQAVGREAVGGADNSFDQWEPQTSTHWETVLRVIRLPGICASRG